MDNPMCNKCNIGHMEQRIGCSMCSHCGATHWGFNVISFELLDDGEYFLRGGDEQAKVFRKGKHNQQRLPSSNYHDPYQPSTERGCGPLARVVLPSLDILKKLRSKFGS